MRHARRSADERVRDEADLHGQDAFSVLLAEDDPEMRCILGRVLRGFGWRVWEVADGEEMLEFLAVGNGEGGRRKLPDLIVSDIRMPGLSGLQVLESLRRTCWATPVLLITAFGDRDTHAEARRLGAAAVLDKPFSLHEFRAALADIAPLVAA